MKTTDLTRMHTLVEKITTSTNMIMIRKCVPVVSRKSLFVLNKLQTGKQGNEVPGQTKGQS